MTDIKRVFMVKGKPFFPLGSEFLYVSGYSIRNQSQTDDAFKLVQEAHGNTALIPVYWDEVEPEEGKFNFTCVDALLASARRYNIKLIPLWFATWKNGNMDFTPSWVKTNPQRFKRVISSTGTAIWVLSSHCKANYEADKKAFTAFCKYLKAKDSTEHTVIGIQVENEPGIIGSDRDYSPEAQAQFDSSVPAKLMNAMKAAGKGRVYDIWQQSGGKESGGAWPEIFGWEAGEIMTAWSIATYIDGIIKAGKAIIDIPMYINAWMMEQRWWPMPGEAYPSGGAVSKLIDIYKWSTPHTDFIAPDNYQLDTKGFEFISASYARDDNPLFVPESAGSPHLLRAIADYNAIGYFAWLRTITDEDGKVDASALLTRDVIRCAASVIPLILKYQGSGKIHAVVEEENKEKQIIDFDGYLGQVRFGLQHHFFNSKKRAGNIRGWGLIIQTSRNEFYLVGDNYQLYLRPRPSVEDMKAPLLVADWTPTLLVHYVSVDEGHFDENGKYIIDCRRNGDQITHGLWLEPQVGVLRVTMCD
jgi:hypothetical protein